MILNLQFAAQCWLQETYATGANPDILRRKSAIYPGPTSAMGSNGLNFTCRVQCLNAPSFGHTLESDTSNQANLA